MSAAQHRYYAYSPQMGRRRIPVPDGLDEIGGADVAVEWASGRGAVNVVREDGPASKPTGVQLVWQRDQPSDYDIRLKIEGVLAEHFPNATVREIGNAARALFNVIK